MYECFFFPQLCEVVAEGIIHIDDLANLNHKQDIKLRTFKCPSVFLENLLETIL